MDKVLLLFLSIFAAINLVRCVSFSANRAISPRNGKRMHFLKFANVITDSNNAFDRDHGSFKAPNKGYYSFQACLRGGFFNPKLSLFKYSQQSGRSRILSLFNRGNRCYSTVLYLNVGEHVYHVVHDKRFNYESEANTFSGHIVGEPGVDIVVPRGKGRPSRFPVKQALPDDDEEPSDNNGDEEVEDKFPHLFKDGK